MKLELKENNELYNRLSELYKEYSLSVDQIMNENQRQWGSPEALLIVVPIIALCERIDKLLNKQECESSGKETDYRDMVNKIFYKPTMRAKDIVKNLPDGVTIKMLMEKGYIKKENPFVYTKM